MKDAVYGSISHALRTLGEAVHAQWVWPSPEAGFAMHLARRLGENLPVDPQCEFHEEALNTAPALATGGFLLESRKPGEMPAVETAFRAGLQRLTARDPLPSDRQSFAFRAVECVGIALGVRTLEIDEPWLRDVISKRITSLESREQDLWARIAMAMAQSALTRERPALRLNDEPTMEEMSLLLCCLCMAPSPLVIRGGTELSDLQETLLTQLMLAGSSSVELARSATTYLASIRCARDRLCLHLSRSETINGNTQAAAQLLGNTLRRFPIFARQMSMRQRGRNPFAIQDEYDVQDALHAILRVHFDDVRSEEWTPSYGGASKRMDFLLKKERIVVEVKMTRRGLGGKEIIAQLAEDKESYRAHPDCDFLYCLVYDPEGHCKNPIAIERDLSGEAGGLTTVVIVAPRGV